MQNKLQIFYLFLFILICSIAFAIYFETNSKRIQLLEEYSLISGVLDLSELKMSGNQIIGIEGEAEFYWNSLLEPDSFRSETLPAPDGFVAIPGTWNQFVYEDEKIGGFGFATYRFVIKVKNDGWYGIRVKEFDSAYKMWINSTMVIENGVVGKSKASSKPDWRRKESYFESVDREIEVIIQISNFSHRKGGAEDRMYFGAADDIMTFKKRNVVMSSVLLGILIMLSLYHLVLYVFRPSDVSILIFTLLSFFMALRLLSTGEKLIFEIFPNINWFLAIRIEYISYQIAFPLVLAFFFSFYKKYIPTWIMKSTVIISALFCLIVIVTPVWIFSYTPLFFQVFVAFVAVYLLVVLFNLTLKGKEHAIFFLIGYVLFMGTLVNDILYYNKVINTTFLLHFGIFILAVSQAFVLSRKYAKAFFRVEQLSGQLSQYNKELEGIVHTRTMQINNQKDEIEAQSVQLKQANDRLLELTRFKENLTEMIVHDLKSPLNVVLNFSEDERVLFAGTQMLNLVHNMLDVQRYEKAQMKLNVKTWPLSPLIKSAISQNQYLIHEKNISVQNKIVNDFKVYADRDIMERVFVNLISNAVKFTPHGGVININAITKDENELKVCIADSGSGIPESMKELVFQKFGQILTNNQIIKGSTGIGLAFCRMAVEAHGGTIDFESTAGIGTTFYCMLQLAEIQTNIEIEHGTISKAHKLQSMVFTPHEKRVLSEIAKAMQYTKLYEIGKIKALLTRIQPKRTENISYWIKCIKESIFNADYEMFNFLLSMADYNSSEEEQ